MRPDPLYPELSYYIVKCAFILHNILGGGLQEAIYEKAIAIEFKEQNIKFIKQKFSTINYKNQKILRNYSDFLVEDLFIVELKNTCRIIASDFKQTKKYLHINMKLGMLFNFGRQLFPPQAILISSVHS